LNDNYNPYLSAERQMAELFDDPVEVRRQRPAAGTAAAGTLGPPPEAPVKSPEAPVKSPEETTSIDQLEKDLKNIFSEISQLGKSNESVAVAVAVASGGSGPEVEKQLPKFCHACGSAYPERYPVKYCCQCGERRLNL